MSMRWLVPSCAAIARSDESPRPCAETCSTARSSRSVRAFLVATADLYHVVQNIPMSCSPGGAGACSARHELWCTPASMHSFAVIGSGQAGLLAAHGLLRAGFDVTLYSDRSPDDWLERARPTGTAVRFARSLAYERELGLDAVHARAPHMDGL